MFFIIKKFQESKNRRKYKKELCDSIEKIARINAIFGNEAVTRHCVFVKPDIDINHIKELYEKCGINLKKHYIKKGKFAQDVLYINVAEFAKINKTLQKFFNDIANTVNK